MYNWCKVTQILAVSKDGFIGDKNTIPWKCREDMRHFARYTKGKICIMGRKTFESIQPPLRGRTVIVVSTDPEIRQRVSKIPNHMATSTIAEALDLSSLTALASEVMIVGGKTIYQQTLQYTDQILLSTIDIELKEGDTKLDWEIPDRIEIIPFEFQVDQ